MWIFAVPLAATLTLFLASIMVEVTGLFPYEASVAELTFVVLASAVGACALIEILKRVFELRGRYHRDSISDWLGAYNGPERKTADKFDTPLGERSRLTLMAVEEFERAAGLPNRTDGRAAARASRAFYDSPLEQLSAQIATAIEKAIQDPRRFSVLVERLAPGYLSSVISYDMKRSEYTREEDDRRVNVLENDRILDEYEVEQARIIRVASETAQQQVDIFQIATGSDWRRSISTWALFIAGLIGGLLGALLLSGSILVATSVSIILGGFLSWVVRDFSAAVARWRGLAS